MITRSYQLRRSVQKTWPDVATFASGRMPSFVYGGHVTSIPIFCYHQIDEAFEADLQFLSAAGYRTLGAAELEAVGRGEHSTDGKQVVLTFDDGHSSLVDVGVPLLEQYGFRAIAFVVVGFVPQSSSHQLAGWDDLSKAVAANVLDVGSHSLHHDHVAVSPRVVGVVDPCTDTAFHANIPIAAPDRRIRRHGLPVLEGSPRYTAFNAFIPDSTSVDAFIEAASSRAKGWTHSGECNPLRLRTLPRIRGSYIAANLCEEAIVKDMARAAMLLSQYCPNPAQRHLCYPWFAGGKRTDRLAKVAGIDFVYKGVRTVSHGVMTDVLPARFGRVPADLLWRLPGPNRKSMAAAFLARLSRRRVSLA